MAADQLITVFVGYGTSSKILCVERENLIDCIRRKFEIESNFHVVQLTRNRKEWRQQTPSTITDMACLRVIEDPSSQINCDPEYGGKIADKLETNEDLNEDEREYLLATLPAQLPKRRRCSSDDVKSESSEKKSKSGRSEKKSKSERKLCKKTQTVALTEPIIPEKWTKAYEIITILRKEAKKTEEYRDVELIDRLLQETFEERRDFIVHQGPKVKQIKQTYPILFEKKYLFAEFERIMENSCVSEFQSNLLVYFKCIIGLVPPSLIPDVVKAEHRKVARGDIVQLSELESSYANMAGALLVLPSLFGNRLDSIIQFETVNPEWDYPIILCEAPLSEALSKVPLFRVYAEGYFLFETNNLIEAVIVYMSVFFIFDISYPTKCSQSLTLIETLLLEHATEQDPLIVKKVRKSIHKKLTCSNGSRKESRH